MCGSLMCDIAHWLIFISACWIGLLAVIALTIIIWQLIVTMIEDFKNDDWQ
jgi:hypothetical protein